MTAASGRPARQAEVQQERRRRDDATIDGGQRLKLAVPEHVAERLKREGRTPRWINDEGNRMHNLTKMDDYDKVAEVAPVVVGTTKEGKPIKAHLCSKPAAFIEQDRAKMETRRRETEAALLRGRNPDAPAIGDGIHSQAYGDDEPVIQANRIHRGGLGPP
jgi:hypothetical protein